MLRVAAALVLISSAGFANAKTASCDALSAPVSPVQRTLSAPVAAEFSAPGRQLGAPAGVLSQALSESLSVEQVLFRIQLERCANLASIAPVASPSSLPAATIAPAAAGSTIVAPDADDPAAYKPKTEFDNTPWRFDMSQNGKSMTADEFDAWMKSRGLRVVGGKFVRALPTAAAATTDGGDAATKPTKDE